MQYIQAAVPVPMRQLFTYKVPENLQTPSINIGERVVVPFAGRNLVAVAVKISESCEYEPEKVKDILARQQDNYLLTETELHFLIQCANYYHYPVGEVICQSLPLLLRQVETVDVKKTEVWLARIEQQKEQENNNTTLEELIKPLIKKSPKQAELFRIIFNHPNITWPELRALGFTKVQLNALVKKELIISKEIIPSAFNWQEKYLNSSNKLKLTVEQALAVSSVTQQLSSSKTNAKFSCHLLEGITGSGKTEVYLQIMEAVLAQNKQVLVLVPEIGLTPQTLNRFEQRFHLPIYLHHSGLNNNERLQTWLAAKQGSAAIIIGTRSAIFSPLKNAGLIIVDEEHDSSLKQQDSFRYHGRDVAILRAKQLNIPIVLGSATPSLETLHNALVGKYYHHQLLTRPGKSVTAKIELIDMATQPVDQGLSATLTHEIEQTLARGEQVLIFLNRRGYAPAVSCKECHYIVHCSRCNKPYTLHQKQQLLICHHCASQKRVIKQCEQCGSVRLHSIGLGTEQLEQRLTEMFNRYSAIRIDRDSTRRKGELTKLLTEVNDKKHQLLIGTQMLAKGHHFPDVTLVAVLDIDGALFSYDFRASEQMAQLLTQVGGRAGRASKPGKVLVQTHYPQHPLLQDLVHNGYHHFALQALTERKLALLPPYSYQVLIRAEANYPSYPEQFLRALTELSLSGCAFAGPIPAAMEKKAGKYRFHLIIQAKQRSDLHRGIATLLAHIKQNPWHNKVRWSLDVDPQDLSW